MLRRSCRSWRSKRLTCKADRRMVGLGLISVRKTRFRLSLEFFLKDLKNSATLFLRFPASRRGGSSGGDRSLAEAVPAVKDA